MSASVLFYIMHTCVSKSLLVFTSLPPLAPESKGGREGEYIHCRFLRQILPLVMIEFEKIFKKITHVFPTLLVS